MRKTTMFSSPSTIVSTHKQFIFLLLWLSVFSVPSFGADTASNKGKRQEIIHVVGGGSTSFKQYYSELIDLALNMSKTKFGGYTLIMEKRIPTPARAVLALQKGEWHTLVMSDLSHEYHNAENIEIISGPYLKALMGLRASIIRREDLNKFRSITTLEALKQFAIGQGDHWTETKIYRNAGLKVVTAKYYDSLFPMLQNKRFDLIPLSVLEIDNALEEVKEQYPDFVIAPNFFIYYPLPVYIAVSKKVPYLADRIKLGVDLALSQKGIDELMKKRFGNTDYKLQSAATNLFQIDNHLIPSNENNQALSYFRKTYLNK